MYLKIQNTENYQDKLWWCYWVPKSCLALCNPFDYSTPGFPVLCLLELAQTHVHWWYHPTISSSVAHFSFCLQSFLASGSFPMRWLFPQVVKVVELQNQHRSFQWIQGWFPLRLVWSSFCQKDSQESSAAPQFESTNSLVLTFFVFPGGSNGEESACNMGNLDSIPGLGRSPGGGRGNPLQYSCLENPHGQWSLSGYSR